MIQNLSAFTFNKHIEEGEVASYLNRKRDEVKIIQKKYIPIYKDLTQTGQLSTSALETQNLILNSIPLKHKLDAKDSSLILSLNSNLSVLQGILEKQLSPTKNPMLSCQAEVEKIKYLTFKIKSMLQEFQKSNPTTSLSEESLSRLKIHLLLSFMQKQLVDLPNISRSNNQILSTLEMFKHLSAEDDSLEKKCFQLNAVAQSQIVDLQNSMQKLKILLVGKTGFRRILNQNNPNRAGIDDLIKFSSLEISKNAYREIISESLINILLIPSGTITIRVLKTIQALRDAHLFLNLSGFFIPVAITNSKSIYDSISSDDIPFESESISNQFEKIRELLESKSDDASLMITTFYLRELTAERKKIDQLMSQANCYLSNQGNSNFKKITNCVTKTTIVDINCYISNKCSQESPKIKAQAIYFQQSPRTHAQFLVDQFLEYIYKETFVETNILVPLKSPLQKTLSKIGSTSNACTLIPKYMRRLDVLLQRLLFDFQLISPSDVSTIKKNQIENDLNSKLKELKVIEEMAKQTCEQE